MMEQELYKVCPECGGEYRLDIERCHDCDVALVYPEEIARRDARELRSSPALVALRTAPIAWARVLAGDLDSQGIGYRIDRRQAREAARTAGPICRRADGRVLPSPNGADVAVGGGVSKTLKLTVDP